jgi:hypothetical protein
LLVWLWLVGYKSQKPSAQYCTASLILNTPRFPQLAFTCQYQDLGVGVGYLATGQHWCISILNGQSQSVKSENKAGESTSCLIVKRSQSEGRRGNQQIDSK